MFESVVCETAAIESVGCETTAILSASVTCTPHIDPMCMEHERG